MKNIGGSYHRYDKPQSTLSKLLVIKAEIGKEELR